MRRSKKELKKIRYCKIKQRIKFCFACGVIFLFFTTCFSFGQIVASQKFGKNRLQFDTFYWRSIESEKFSFLFYDSLNVEYVNQISKIVLDELNIAQSDFDVELTTHFNVLFYYSYEHYLQSNAGIHLDWYYQNPISRVANNKLIIYYVSDTEKLRLQIKQGIVRIILETIFTGYFEGEKNNEEEIASLPKWFIYSLIAYKAEVWNTDLDYKLKVILKDNKYKKFQHLVVADPVFAGQVFWYFVQLRYGNNIVQNIISQLKFNKNIKDVFLVNFGQKYKRILKLIFPYFLDIYTIDDKKRKDNPQGKVLASTSVLKKEVVTIQANPSLKKGIYGIVEFKNGVYKVFVSENNYRKRHILTTGINLYQSSLSANYPLIGWSQNGINLGVIFYDQSFIHFFEYDAIEKTKKNNINLSLYFSQIHSFTYFKNGEKLLLSAVKNGQSDIFIFDLKTADIEHITNDVYDDINPAYVAFPGKVGILFSSNRPTKYINDAQKTLRADIQKEKFKIFMADYAVEKNYHYLTPLIENDFGNLLYPSQFSPNTFSYISDENGIKNRYVANFTSVKNKMDTMYRSNNKFYFNLSSQQKDSLSKIQKINSIQYYLNTTDRTKSAPITNYANNIIESKNVNGKNVMVTDLKYTRYAKVLYKANEKVESIKKVADKLIPTSFIKYLKNNFILNASDNILKPKMPHERYKDSAFYFKDFFISEFQFDPFNFIDSINKQATENEAIKPTETIISNVAFESKINTQNYKYVYKFFKLKAGLDIFSNELIGDRYQPYGNGQGPIQSNNQGLFNGTFSISVSDILENVNVNGSYRMPLPLLSSGSAFLIDFNYLKYRTDFGFTYFRNVTPLTDKQTNISNSYLLKMSYPLNILKKINFNLGFRRDLYNYAYSAISNDLIKPTQSDSIVWNLIFRTEYVYDNTITTAYNINKGLKYKIYAEYFTNLTKKSINQVKSPDKFSLTKNTINIGFDIRYYKHIYKNMIWATRTAGDFSFGKNRVLYYLGGTDGWLYPKFDNSNQPKNDIEYAYQSLGLNLRGYKQNVLNGTNNIVINSELRIPILTTIFNSPIKSSFLRNIQFITFADMGTAWNGAVSNIKTPSLNYTLNNVTVAVKGLSPVAIGYGYGLRTLIASYFIRFDVSYPVPYFFKQPIYYFCLGLDF